MRAASSGRRTSTPRAGAKRGLSAVDLACVPSGLMPEEGAFERIRHAALTVMVRGDRYLRGTPRLRQMILAVTRHGREAAPRLPRRAPGGVASQWVARARHRARPSLRGWPISWLARRGEGRRRYGVVTPEEDPGASWVRFRPRRTWSSPGAGCYRGRPRTRQMAPRRSWWSACAPGKGPGPRGAARTREQHARRPGHGPSCPTPFTPATPVWIPAASWRSGGVASPDRPGWSTPEMLAAADRGGSGRST